MNNEEKHPHWFEPIADHLGAAYLRYSFTYGTENEVARLYEILELNPGDRLLDVGCGPGRHSHLLAEKGIDVLGVDISKEFIKIATGENGYTIAHFATLLEKKGASVLNVDVTICPGYDVALKVANMAARSGVTIAPHGCQELQLSLAAAVKHGEFLENYPTEVDPLRSDMFYPKLVLDSDGFVTVPDRPGIGFELNMDLLNRYRVS